MKKIKLAFGTMFLLCLIVSIFAFTSSDVNSTNSTTSSCSLVNPPRSFISWNFWGNQLVWVTVKNGNFLGVTATLNCATVANTKSWFLLPAGSTGEIRYDIFGNLPISWRFTLSTISDAALIYGQAHWAQF